MALTKRTEEERAARAELKQAERAMRDHARTHSTAWGVAPGDQVYYAQTRNVVAAARSVEEARQRRKS